MTWGSLSGQGPAKIPTPQSCAAPGHGPGRRSPLSTWPVGLGGAHPLVAPQRQLCHQQPGGDRSGGTWSVTLRELPIPPWFLWSYAVGKNMMP